MCVGINIFSKYFVFKKLNVVKNKTVKWCQRNQKYWKWKWVAMLKKAAGVNLAIKVTLEARFEGSGVGHGLWGKNIPKQREQSVGVWPGNWKNMEASNAVEAEQGKRRRWSQSGTQTPNLRIPYIKYLSAWNNWKDLSSPKLPLTHTLCTILPSPLSNCIEIMLLCLQPLQTQCLIFLCTPNS